MNPLTEKRREAAIDRADHVSRSQQTQDQAEETITPGHGQQVEIDETVIEGFRPDVIKRPKTVAWKDDDKNVALVTETEADGVTDDSDSTYETNKLKLIPTSPSRFIAFGKSDEVLSNQLLQAIDETSHYKTDTGNSGFLSNTELFGIINEISILSLLRKINQPSKNRIKDLKRTIEEEARVICPRDRGFGHKSFRKILTILLLIGRPRAITWFISKGVCDSDLPLTKVPLPTNHKAFALSRKDGNGGPDVDVKSLVKWNRFTIRDFEHKQWKVLAPFFSLGNTKEVLHYRFEDQVILPFTYHERKRRGEHADIFKVQIHPEHHSYDEDENGNPFFAVKTLFGNTDFSQEVRMLKRLRNVPDQIVTLLATYEYRGEYHLIFPWAHCDLETYWEHQNPNPTHDQKTVAWIASQCESIAVGLNSVHHHLTNTGSSILVGIHRPHKEPPAIHINPSKHGSVEKPPPLRLVFGRHGDIKPSNLLWFPNPNDSSDKGTVKISDFGTGEFSPVVSFPTTSSSAPHTPPYRPPECDLPDSELNSSYDIWTLACLYLEFITWYIGGWRLLEEFRNQKQRKKGVPWTNAFFMLEEGNDTSDQPQQAKVRPEVLEFMNQLEADPACSDFFRWFLKLIRESMLLITPLERTTCRNVFLKLGEQAGKCEEDSGYAVGQQFLSKAR